MTHLAGAELAERTRQLIARAGLSLSEISRYTRAKYGTGSSYFIAESLISTIKRGVSPRLYQVAALSEVTCYRFADLMQHFGFDLGQLTRLKMKLHLDRTVLITPNECCAVPTANLGRYLYAQIGRQDGMGFPEVMPGSIVRIDTRHTFAPATSKSDSRRSLYLVDHLRGLSCCYVTALNRNEILLTPHYLPYKCLQYRVGDQARILGLVDAELRPLQNIEVPETTVSSEFERRAPIPAVDAPQRLSQLVRNARERVGFHFRQARDLSARVAEELGDHDYAIALGTLSDYEAGDTVPRHISKIISLCIVYAIDFGRYLSSAGIRPNSCAQRAPSEIDPGPPPVSASLLQMRERNDGATRLSQPYFPPCVIEAQSEQLRNKSDCLQCFSLPTSTKRDGSPETLFIVNRCATTLEKSAWPAAWQRPVYVVRKRDGKYVYGFCTVTDGIMTVHHDPAMSPDVERFYRKEADVVGQVVSMVRSIG